MLLPGESSPFVVELVTFLPLLYLSLCTYRSLFKFRLFGDFCLKVRHIHTNDPDVYTYRSLDSHDHTMKSAHRNHTPSTLAIRLTNPLTALVPLPPPHSRARA
jgi:hypothetical protein